MSGRSRRKKLVRSKRLKESDSDIIVKAGATNVASAGDLQPSSGDEDYGDAELFQPLVNTSYSDQLANQLILERDRSLASDYTYLH